MRELAYFLDDVGVQPCGHSARKENILLSVFASCKSHQIPHTLLYSARGRGNDEDTGELYDKHCGYEVVRGQNTSWINNTRITCKKGASYADPCLIANDFTWDKQRENERIQLVGGGKSQGRRGWWYVFLKDDEETEQLFSDKIKSGGLKLSDVTDYGCVFKSGWGQDPPEELQRAIARRRDVTKHTYY